VLRASARRVLRLVEIEITRQGGRVATVYTDQLELCGSRRIYCRSPLLRGHMRLASYVPAELIPLPLSGSIPELPHVAKVFFGMANENS
jgi:hypothetical protein